MKNAELGILVKCHKKFACHVTQAAE